MQLSDDPQSALSRFELKRVLGAGGVGVVYEAFDRLESTHVALKTLQRMTPAGLYYFKQEFRALADVSHPNLISLFELGQENGIWFFTMELLQGHPFLRHVREPMALDGQTLTQDMGRAEAAEGLSSQDSLRSDFRSLSAELERSRRQEPVAPALGTPSLAGRSPGTAPERRRSLLERAAELDVLADPEDITRTLTFAPPPDDVLEAARLAVPLAPETPARVRVEGTSLDATPRTRNSSPFFRVHPLDRLDHEKLRRVLPQLVDAIMRIHAAGKLHRDLKSSNVLVTAEGRLVVLDFGLVQALEQAVTSRKPPEEGVDPGAETELSYQSRVDCITGTPAYMAPEAFYGRFSPASDWWAVGVMLYQALTGHLPFKGKLLQLIQAVIQCRPVPPSVLVSDVPSDLETLCLRLLSLDPSRRPEGAEILRMLGAERSGTPLTPTASLMDSLFSSGMLVGREKQLAQLDAALRCVEQGAIRLVRVQGLSGMGKSAMIQHFLSDVQVEHRALVLSGRCYERETLTYKAFDTILDALLRILKTFHPEDVQAMLPPDLPFLVRLFPVLERLEVKGKGVELPTADPHEIRLRAFHALRALMVKLTARRPVILMIDDLQWGDADSAPLLLELLRQPGAPALLVIGSYRSDELDRSPFLKALRALGGAEPTLQEEEVMEVGPLVSVEAESLVRAGLEHSHLDTHMALEPLVARILEEGQGHPIFLNLLVQRALARGGQLQSGERLEQLIYEAVAGLPAQAQRLVEAVAIAGRPLPHSILKRAIRVEHLEAAGLGLLRSAKLVRSSSASGGGEEIEMYHDRLRSAITERLSSEGARAHHLALALALEDAEGAEPEWLADHFEAAESLEKAQHYALLSARKAMDSLAFDLAAGYYRRALKRTQEHRAADGEGQNALRLQLAEALKLASRGREAAEVYLEMSAHVPATLAFDYRRQAAELLMRTGFIEEGRALLSSLLQHLGMKFAKSPGRALLSYLLSVVWLTLRGYGLGRYAPDAPDVARRLNAIDLATSISDSMVYSSMADSLDFHGQRILMALRLGEPSRAIRSLGSEHAFLATQGYRARDKVQRIHNKATQLLRQHYSPMPAIALHLGYGTALMWMGFNLEARDEYKRADLMLQEQPSELLWERGMAKTLHLVCQKYLGEWVEMHAAALELVPRFQTLRDRLEEAAVRLRILSFSHLLRGELAEARAQVTLGEQSVPKEVSLWTSYLLRARVEQLLIERQGRDAWGLVDAQWKALEPMLVFEFERIFGYLTFGHAALGAACDAGPGAFRAARLKQAHWAYRRIARMKAPHALAQAGLLRAGIYYLEGNLDAAVAHLDETIAGARRWHHAGVVALAQLRRGALVRGDEGRGLMTIGHDALRARGAADPKRLADALVGWWVES